MGADKAILVSTESRTDQELLPLHVAKILRKIVEQEQPDLVILGKQSIDGDFNQTPQMLAGLLDWPQGTFASKIEVDSEGKVGEDLRSVSECCVEGGCYPRDRWRIADGAAVSSGRGLL